MSKHQNILRERASFFISVREFKRKFFEQLFHCGWQSYKIICSRTVVFNEHANIIKHDKMNMIKHYSTKVPQNCFESFICSNQTLRKNCPYSELFWSVFCCIQTKYRESLYSAPMLENADQNNSKYGQFSRSDRHANLQIFASPRKLKKII